MLATLTRETLSQIRYPELKRPPHGLKVPLVPRGKVKMPRGISPQLATSPPATAWPRIMAAIPEFGLNNLYVYAPEEAFRTKADPAIIAEKDGKYYLIAAWE